MVIQIYRGFLKPPLAIDVDDVAIIPVNDVVQDRRTKFKRGAIVPNKMLLRTLMVLFRMRSVSGVWLGGERLDFEEVDVRFVRRRERKKGPRNWRFQITYRGRPLAGA